MATQKPGGWVQSLITRFDSQVTVNHNVTNFAEKLKRNEIKNLRKKF